MSKLSKCKLDRILGTKQYFQSSVFVFFGLMYIFIYLFGPLDLVYWTSSLSSYRTFNPIGMQNRLVQKIFERRCSCVAIYRQRNEFCFDLNIFWGSAEASFPFDGLRRQTTFEAPTEWLEKTDIATVWKHPNGSWGVDFKNYFAPKLFALYAQLLRSFLVV